MNEILAYKLNLIPHQPGCYLWKDIYQQVIYVGKAIDLYKRTHQYFAKKDHDPKTKKLVSQIADVDFIVVNNENESLILENDLIKKYQPKFNILLKEGSNYPYIGITKETHPRLIYTRNFDTKCYHYYGPFADNKSNRYEIFNLVNQIFKLRKCYRLPKKKCLYYDLGQCFGPCIHQINQATYLKTIHEIDDFFKGNTQTTINELLKREKKHAEALEFEEATQIKQTIESIKAIQSKQNINFVNRQPIDVVGYHIKDEYIAINIFSYINGKLLTKNQQIGQLTSSTSDTLISYLMQYYRNNQIQPKKCYVALDPQSLKHLSQILNIQFIHPQKGRFHEIMINASINAKEYYQSNYYQYLKNLSLNSLAFDELRNMIHIDNLSLIHSFDMSNLFADAKVGAMIALVNGEFNKKLYRKFIIDNQSLSGDTQYMQEVVYREYTNVLKQHEPLPNLIIVDGGINQINAVKSSLDRLHLKQIIPVIGLAKNNKHQTDRLCVDKNTSIKLDPHSNLYLYLQKIQEEVHRFAISFFRKKKTVSLFRSKLQEIPGIGPATINKLLKIYNNVVNIQDAPIDELAQYVGKANAIKIKASLK